MSDNPTIHYNVRRAVMVGKPMPILIDPGTGPSEETIHEQSAGRIGQNISEKERMLKLMKKKEYLSDELRSTRDLIRIQKEKTAGFQLAHHLLDGFEFDLEKDAIWGKMMSMIGKGRGVAARQAARRTPAQVGRIQAKTGAPKPPPVMKPTKPVAPSKPTPPAEPTPPARPPAGGKQLTQQDLQKALEKQRQVGEMPDVEALKAWGQLGGPKPGGLKKFLAGGTGQFLAQMGMMMFPYHMLPGMEDSALGQVAPLAAFMLAPGAIAKYTGAGAARTGLQKHLAGGGTIPQVGSVTG